MPENAYRRGHLYSHLAAQTTEPYSLARIKHLHPDWPLCTAGCGWPVDPAALVGGYTTHPLCGKEMSHPRTTVEAPAGERVNAQAGRLDPVTAERSPA